MSFNRVPTRGCPASVGSTHTADPAAGPERSMEIEADRGAFGPVLRRFRLAAGMSQEELVERAHLSAESISALERGQRRAPYRETIRLIARALLL
jgi:DNA-binding XRE family transcriptional regulator